MVCRRYKRLSLVLVFTYASAIAGLTVTFLGGIDDPTTSLSAVGIALLFASFVGMFYASVTVLSVGDLPRQR